MDIRSFFTSKKEGSSDEKPEKKKKVPVIRDDDEDFKASSSSSRSKGKAGKMSQHRSGQKRKKARIRDDSESEADEAVPHKKRSPHASDASRKSVTPRKVKELKSLSDFFGSTPIRRTEKQRAESKASATRPPITCVPESPPKSICVDSSTGQQLELATHRDVEFNKTLLKLDASPNPRKRVNPTSNITPTKKLKIVLERTPVKGSHVKSSAPAKGSVVKGNKTSSAIMESTKEDKQLQKKTPVKTKGELFSVATARPSLGKKEMKARKAITYIDDDSTDRAKCDDNVESTHQNAPPEVVKKVAETKDASAHQKQSPNVTSKQKKPVQASPSAPKLGRTESYKAYLNRSGPKSPGSKEIPEGKENCFEGLTFVITGVLESLEREEAIDLIRKYGGKLTKSVSKKTSYLVVGDDSGPSKVSKASSVGTKQITEDELLELIRSRSLPGFSGRQPKTKKSKSQKSNVTSSSRPAERPLLQASPSPIASTVPSTSVVKSSEQKSLLWVDKYRPSSMKQLIGQHGERSSANKLCQWLRNWQRNQTASTKPGGAGAKDDGGAYKAALLSGPPGVGKTTTACLVCEECGYTYTEMNASANRSKKMLQKTVSGQERNFTISAFLPGGGGVASGSRHVLIMDEVDGMSGTDDRGGIGEVISMIKSTKVPIICICNDRNDAKVRTLANHCFDLRFYKPKVEQIKGAMMSVAFKENLKISPQALEEVIMASGQDIRQVLNTLSIWCVKDKKQSFEQAKHTAKESKKELKLNPFEVVKLVFMPKERERELTLQERSELFFHDYNIAPLFVQENYLSFKPLAARGDLKKCLDIIALAADALCEGDLVERKIRRNTAWNLLPLQSMLSSVIPGYLVRGYLGKPDFPQWLGQNSKRSRIDRLLQEVQLHTRLETSGNKTEFGMDYLPFLHSRITTPLIKEGNSGIDAAVEVMNTYSLLRNDFDALGEVVQFAGRPDISAQISSKVKAAFTRAYKKQAHVTPYTIHAIAKKQPVHVEGEEGNESNESDEEVSTSAMFKAVSTDRKQKKPKGKSK